MQQFAQTYSIRKRKRCVLRIQYTSSVLDICLRPGVYHAEPEFYEMRHVVYESEVRRFVNHCLRHVLQRLRVLAFRT